MQVSGKAPPPKNICDDPQMCFDSDYLQTLRGGASKKNSCENTQFNNNLSVALDYLKISTDKKSSREICGLPKKNCDNEEDNLDMCYNIMRLAPVQPSKKKSDKSDSKCQTFRKSRSQIGKCLKEKACWEFSEGDKDVAESPFICVLSTSFDRRKSESKSGLGDSNSCFGRKGNDKEDIFNCKRDQKRKNDIKNFLNCNKSNSGPRSKLRSKSKFAF